MNGIWIFLVAGLILGFLLILSNHYQSGKGEKSQKRESAEAFLGKDNSYEKESDEEDDLLEDFLLIELLDEDDEEE